MLERKLGTSKNIFKKSLYEYFEKREADPRKIDGLELGYCTSYDTLDFVKQWQTEVYPTLVDNTSSEDKSWLDNLIAKCENINKAVPVDQSTLLIKLYQYCLLSPEKRDPEFVKLLQSGHCSGFSTLVSYALWLEKQPYKQDKVERDDWSFVSKVFNTLSTWNGKISDLDSKETKDIDRVLSLVFYFQNIRSYQPIGHGNLESSLEDTQNRKLVRNYDIASRLTEIESQNVIHQLLSSSDSKQDHDDLRVLVSSHNHDTIITKHDNDIYYYDPNNLSGPLLLKNDKELGLLVSLANEFKQDTVAPLGLRVFSLDSQRNFPEQKELLKDTDYLTKITEKNNNYDNRQGLHIAAYIGSTKSAEVLLSAGAEVDAKDTQGFTPIQIAIFQHQLPMLKLLLDHKSDIQQKDKQGNSLLHRAVDANAFAEAKYLIEKGLDVDIKNSFDTTPIQSAIQQSNSDLVKLLLENKADIQQVNKYGNSLLHLAVEANNLYIAKLLINHTVNIDVDVKNLLGNTPIQSAIKKSKSDLVQLLLESKADIQQVNEFGENLLHLAVKSNNLNIAKLLINKGVDIQAVDMLKKTPLVLAIESDKKEMVDLILGFMSEDSLKPKSKIDDNVLQTAIRNNAYRSAESILKKNPSLINEVNSVKDSPLHLAILKNQAEMVSVLLKHNADPFLKDIDKKDCFDIAIEKNNKAIFEKLLNHKKLSSEQADEIAIKLVKNSNKDLLDILLLKYKINFAKTDLLSIAVKNKNPDMVSMLLNLNQTDVILKNSINIATELKLDNISTLIKNSTPSTLKELLNDKDDEVDSVIQSSNSILDILQEDDDDLDKIKEIINPSIEKAPTVSSPQPKIVDVVQNKDQFQPDKSEQKNKMELEKKKIESDVNELKKNIKNEMNSDISSLKNVLGDAKIVIQDYINKKSNKSNKNDKEKLDKSKMLLNEIDKLLNRLNKDDYSSINIITKNIKDIISKDKFCKYKDQTISEGLEKIYAAAGLGNLEKAINKIIPYMEIYNNLSLAKSQADIGAITAKLHEIKYGSPGTIVDYLNSKMLNDKFIGRPFEDYKGTIIDIKDNDPRTVSLEKLSNTSFEQLSVLDKQNIINFIDDVINSTTKAISTTDIMSRFREYNSNNQLNENKFNAALKQAPVFQWIQRFQLKQSVAGNIKSTNKEIFNQNLETIKNMANDKLAEYEKFETSFKVSGVPNLGKSNILEDWNRALNTFTIRVDGKKLSPQKIDTIDDLKKFLNDKLLSKVSTDKKNDALEYIMKSVHQGGLLHPVASELAIKVPKITSGKFGLVSGHEGHSREIDFKTADYGFSVQEKVEIKKIQSGEAPYNELESSTKGSPLLSMSAKINVDLSNPNSPILAVVDQSVCMDRNFKNVLLKMDELKSNSELKLMNKAIQQLENLQTDILTKNLNPKQNNLDPCILSLKTVLNNCALKQVSLSDAYKQFFDNLSKQLKTMKLPEYQQKRLSTLTDAMQKKSTHFVEEKSKKLAVETEGKSVKNVRPK